MKPTRHFLRILPVAAVAIAAASCSNPPPAMETPAPAEKPAVSKKPRLKPSERGDVSTISLEETFAHQQAGSALIYDARPSVLFNAGHIAGAINIPKSIVEDVIKVRESELKAAKAAGKPIIVYCSGPMCSDSRTVARHLASHGYSSSIFSGGWEAWKAADLPTE